jgi:DNA-binding LacI/PurR family transcriptional regulator/DNA-binding transcriptional regulator YhcF (GntR family)
MQAMAQPQVEALAEQVLGDIRGRGLVAGDRYLTADEVRKQLGVAKNLVNDALKLLAERQILVRRQRAGTFIGPRFRVAQEAEPGSRSRGGERVVLPVVHVLMPMDYYRANIISGNVFVDELSRSIPGASVQLHHIADDQVSSYSQELITQLTTSGRREGLVLIRSSRETQRAAQASGLPVVVFGSTYPDVDRLCSLDPDQRRAGELAAEAALKRGHERFALIMRNTWRRGDNLLMEGVSEVLGQAGIGVDRVRVLSTPEDAAVIEHDVDDLLSESPHPTALICRSRFHAEAAVRGIRDRGLEPGRDVMVICLQGNGFSDHQQVTSIVPTLDGPSQVARVGQLLMEVAKHGGCERRVHQIPVRLSEVDAEPG